MVLVTRAVSFGTTDSILSNVLCELLVLLLAPITLSLMCIADFPRSLDVLIGILCNRLLLLRVLVLLALFVFGSVAFCTLPLLVVVVVRLLFRIFLPVPLTFPTHPLVSPFRSTFCVQNDEPVHEPIAPNNQ